MCGSLRRVWNLPSGPGFGLEQGPGRLLLLRSVRVLFVRQKVTHSFTVESKSRSESRSPAFLR